jgi:hypothetical protein
MKSKHRTNYGVFDLSRQIARRVQREWETVESPPPPQCQPDLIQLLPFEDPWRPPSGRRPLAA